MTTRQLKVNFYRFLSVQKWLQAHLVFWTFVLGITPQLHGCGGGADVTAANSSNHLKSFTPVEGELAFTTLDAGQQSGLFMNAVDSLVSNTSAQFPAPAYLKSFNNRSDWSAFWTKHQSSSFPPATIPAVDFAKQTVAAVFMGQAGGCDSVNVVSVALEGAHILVQYRTNNAAANNANLPEGQQIACPSWVTSPYQIIAIPATNIPVVFMKV